MPVFRERYVNPFTDFGFKKLFGEEPNKDLLMDFLSELLGQETGRIVSLKYLKDENLGTTELDRKAIFDLYCENEKGEKFIVEMQKSKHNYFKDRTLYYSTFPIRQQGARSDWDFKLKAVYMVAILDFVFDADKMDNGKYRYDVKLTDIDTCEVFYDKLTFTYLEMPKFNLNASELKNRTEKWLYVLKNLSRLDAIPENFRERIFERFFDAAEIAKFKPEQLEHYEDSLRGYRDFNAVMKTAKDESWEKGRSEGEKEGLEQGIEKGIEKGIEQGLEKVIRNCLALDMSIEQIVSLTGVNSERIKSLANEMKG